MGATTGAIIASSLITAGAGAAVASKQRRSAARLARERLAAQKETARRKRVADVTAIEKERKGEQRSQILAQAQAQQLQNQALQARGVRGRKLGGFGDITQSVLDEGAGV
jgi:hypothetical protein